MNDLELVSTDDLLDEIMKRFDHVVFIGRKDGAEEPNVYHRRWAGDYHTCIGLSHDMQDRILSDLIEIEEDEDD